MAKRKPTNQDLAIVTLLLGSVSLLAFLWWFISVTFGVLAIIFGVKAIKARQDKGRTVAGLALAVTGIVLSLSVMLLVAILPSKNHLSTADSYRESEMAGLSIQMSNVLSSSNATRVESTDLSTDGFTVITSISTTNKPTKTSVLFEADKNCSGAASVGSYSITVLMDNGSPYCTGYQRP